MIRMGVALGGGWTALSAGTIADRMARMKANGVRWVRFDISWSSIQPSSRSSFSWTATDTLVDAAAAAGMNILGILDSAPNWSHVGLSGPWYPPTNPADFATFCSAAVARYRDRIQHWEVWNEPNIPEFWKASPDVAAYTALLRAAFPAIKAADPTAFVISAGLSPAVDDATHVAPRTFCSGMYANGAQGYFDAFGMHPYCTGILVSDGAPWCAWTQTTEASPSVRSIMDANGDGAKPVWLTEYGASTGGTGGTTVTEAFQAQNVTDGHAEARLFPWIGALFWYTYTDTGGSAAVDFMGLLRSDGSEKPGWAAYGLAAVADNPTTALARYP